MRPAETGEKRVTVAEMVVDAEVALDRRQRSGWTRNVVIGETREIGQRVQVHDCLTSRVDHGPGNRVVGERLPRCNAIRCQSGEWIVVGQPLEDFPKLMYSSVFLQSHWTTKGLEIDLKALQYDQERHSKAESRNGGWLGLSHT